MPFVPKVLTIYYKHKRGGFCKRLRLKIEAYLAAGWQVHYIAVEPLPYNHPNLHPHILWCPFARHEGWAFWAYFFSATPLYALWLGSKLRFNLISSVSPLYAWIARPLKRWRRIPQVTFLWTKPQFTTDCHRQYRPLGKVERLMEQTGLNSSSPLIANSEAGRTAWIQEYQIDSSRIQVLPNNVVPPTPDREAKRSAILAEFGLPRDAFLIASSGIFENHKNFEALIAAFSHVKDSRAFTMLIGGGEQRSYLKKVARALNVADRLLFPGWREDVSSLIQGCDLFVFPSLREGMSESLLEAAVCGIPVLVSAIPENMEVIRDPEHHFSPHESRQLAEKIQRCLEDRDYYEQLRENTRRDGERFVFDWGRRLVTMVRPLLP